MKIPKRSACAGSVSPTVIHVAIDAATDARDAKKHMFDKLLLLFIIISFLLKAVTVLYCNL